MRRRDQYQPLPPTLSCFGSGVNCWPITWSTEWRLFLRILLESGPNLLPSNSSRKRREWFKVKFPRASVVWGNHLCSCGAFLTVVYLGNSFLLLSDIILPRHILECWLVPVFALFLENVRHTWVLKDLQTQSSVSWAASHNVRIEISRLMLWTLVGGGEGWQVTGGCFWDAF